MLSALKNIHWQLVKTSRAITCNNVKIKRNIPPRYHQITHRQFAQTATDISPKLKKYSILLLEKKAACQNDQRHLWNSMQVAMARLQGDKQTKSVLLSRTEGEDIISQLNAREGRGWEWKKGV